MQPVSVAQPLRRFGSRDQAALAIGVDDVFGDRAGLGDGVAVVGNHGRFSKRVNGAQLHRRSHVGLPLIADDLIGHAKFFQQPKQALGAGVVQMMDREHGIPPEESALRAGRWCQPDGRKSRCPDNVGITRMLLT